MNTNDERTAEGLEVGTIVFDEFEDGLRFIVMRGPASLCAYIGIPLEHPLAGFSYDDLPVSAHYGLTFSAEGGGTRKEKDGTEKLLPWPAGYYWYGWDYAHAGDKTDFDYPADIKAIRDSSEDKNWTVKDVVEDSWETLWDFKKLMSLAEKIHNKKLTPNKE